MPLIHLKTKNLEYKFEITDKYNVLKGDSGTGKTTLYNLAEALSQGNVVQNHSDIKVMALPNNIEFGTLTKYEGVVFIVDENNMLFRQKDIASILKNSKNYFILIIRSLCIEYLPINVKSIYKMVSSGKFHMLKPFYQKRENSAIKDIDVIITEDKKSSYLFLKDMLTPFNKVEIVEPAYGNSMERREGEYAGKAKIVSTIGYKSEQGCKNIVLVYDSAAFGMLYDKLLESFKIYKNTHFYLVDWDSFEGYILNSEIYKNKWNMSAYNYSYESLE